MIQKYASADARTPKLNKLGTKEWSKTKTKVRGAVQEVAKDLVELYAKRQQNEGYRYGKDTVWQKEFEEMFPFEETEDQLAAIEAAKEDMESSKIMDRLICGDVGYGKTEIALRAAFKAGGKTGGVSGSHYDSGTAALQYLYTEDERISHSCGSSFQVSDGRRTEKNDHRSEERLCGYCDRHPQSAFGGRGI